LLEKNSLQVMMFHEFGATHEASQSWLSDFRSSILENFVTPSVPFVGALTDPFKYGLSVPPVQWLVRCHIPVWYTWGAKEIGEAKRNESFRQLQPPLYVLDTATELSEPAPWRDEGPSSMSISSPQNDIIEDGLPMDYNEYSRELARRRRIYLKSKPWAELFNVRKAKFDEYLKKETPSNRIKRLNREKTPPTKSAEVLCSVTLVA
jgi:hypothetical protein